MIFLQILSFDMVVNTFMLNVRREERIIKGMANTRLFKGIFWYVLWVQMCAMFCYKCHVKIYIIL